MSGAEIAHHHPGMHLGTADDVILLLYDQHQFPSLCLALDNLHDVGMFFVPALSWGILLWTFSPRGTWG